MQHKQYKVTCKQVGPESDRTLRFNGSDETVDRDGDVIDVAGWDLDNYMKNPVVLWAHDGSTNPPIGKTVNLNKDLANKRLVFDIKFPTLEELSSDVDNASEHAKFVDTIYNMCKNGYLNAVSVGFQGIKFKTRDDDDALDLPEWQRGTHYMEQELYEISICSVPANPNALQAAKSKGLIDDYSIKSFFGAQKSAIPYKKYPLADEDTAWDGPKEIAAADTDDLKIMCAWYDAENADVKSSYKLPHHEQNGYKVVWKAVAAAMAALLGARGGVDIPESDKKAVYNHLAKHYKDFGKDVPDYKTLNESEVKAMLEKSGARLSDDSKEALSDIHKALSDNIAAHKSAHKDAMESYKAITTKLDGGCGWGDVKDDMMKAFDNHDKAHKKACKGYKECADKLMKFIDPDASTGAQQQDGGTSDGVERAINELNENIKTLIGTMQKSDPQSTAEKQIDLDSIHEKDLAETIGKIMKQKLNAATGKI